jgi:hypothetical protein
MILRELAALKNSGVLSEGQQDQTDRIIRRYEKLIDDIMVASMDNERIGDIIEKELDE